MVNLQQTRTPAWTGSSIQGIPHLESGVLAHEIAHQYFGHVIRPASSEDFWIAESFAETYAVLYLGAAFGEDVLQDRLAVYGKQWERDLRKTRAFASLTRPYSHRSAIIYHWGPYVLLHMLHGRIGNDAFFGAVDGLTREFSMQDVRTQDIQAAFELASGEDLTDFFDFWIRGGFRPEIELNWTDQGSTIALDIESSVPFGTFDVPVVIASETGEVRVWVDVVDGHGQVTVDSPGAAPRVSLDPDHMVLATRRRVRKR
jgi:aminopeptidase N